jgi:hypothetical protein
VRQDRFLYVAVATLLHLAEDPNVQLKMRKKVSAWHIGIVVLFPDCDVLSKWHGTNQGS